MINKKEFDLILQEVFQIENKIEEMKILNRFDKATEFNNILDELKLKAKDIQIDDSNNSEGFDDISLDVLTSMIKLNSDVDYYVLTANNIIASAAENKIDSEALKQIKKLWDILEEDINTWNESTHNPINEIEHNKQIGKIALDIIIYRLQIEAVIDYTDIYKYCKKEYLISAIKDILYDGAKDEQNDAIKRQALIDLAKKLSEKDLYDYKLWQQILKIKDLRARDDHIEIIGNLLEKDNRKYYINSKNSKEDKHSNLSENKDIDVYNYESIFTSIKRWFSSLRDSADQNKMFLNWATPSGPAFKCELKDETTRFFRDHIDKSTAENIVKLSIATDGVTKYHFDKYSSFKNLTEIEFLSRKNTSSVSLSPDKTYKCIGNETFANCDNLEKVTFGKIEMIGERAFENCKNLTTITFSESLKNIGDDAFLNCENITSVEFLGNLEMIILNRPQNILDCFKGTRLEEITFSNIDNAFNFVITDCPNLKRITVSEIPGIEIPFKTCKYRLGRQEGIVSFVGEKSLNLWKKRNSTIKFFELTNDDKNNFNIK